MDYKGCDCASKAQYLPVPAGFFAVYRGGERGYFLRHLAAVRFSPLTVPIYLGVLGEEASAVLHEPTQTVYVLPGEGVILKAVLLADWLAEVTE